MDYRIGKCSQCGAEYKVPASFAHSSARCKQCKGVVHLGPPQGAPGTPSPQASAMPAKKVVPKPEATRPAASEASPAPASAAPSTPKAEPAAAEKKGGTLERLRAERAAAASPAPSSAAAPAPKPASVAPAKAVTPPAKPAAPSAPAKPAAPARASGSRKGSDEDSSSKSGRRAAKERPEKKRPVGGLLSALGLVVVAAVLILFRGQIFGPGTPAEGDPNAVSAAGPETQGGTAQEPSTPPAPTADSPTTESSQPAPETTPEVASQAPSEPAAAKEKEKPAEAKVKDPASIDLAAIADFGPTPDTSAEEWTQMKEWVLQWMDIDAGAAGNRAGLKLKEMKRKAVPAILNHFKTLDFSTAAGRKSGDLCQKMLQDIWNGTNFDWRYPNDAAGKPVTDPNDVWFCKRATELWCSLWKQAEENIEVWIQRAKLEEKDPEEAARLRQTFGKPGEASQPSGYDDLDVD